MKRFSLLLICFSCFWATAQDDSLALPQFEDVDSRPVKRYATNKVLYATPNRFISAGYEYQGAHDISAPEFVQGPRRFDAARGLRLAFNTPVLSTTRGILNLGITYWGTRYSGTAFPDALYSPLREHGLRSGGLNATFFKPFNERNFLIAQAGTDVNTLMPDGADLTGEAFTVSATAIYGWKKSDSLMWGLGASRTYRMGRLIYVPVLLYNRTFNDRWGVELLLPARGFIRRNINTKTLATLGYELEGNQYALYNTAGSPTTFLQRGEVKPRLNFERNIAGFWWVAVQAGVRVNGRFVVVDRYDGKESNQVVTPTLGNPFYVNVSLNLVSL